MDVNRRFHIKDNDQTQKADRMKPGTPALAEALILNDSIIVCRVMQNNSLNIAFSPSLYLIGFNQNVHKSI